MIDIAHGHSAVMGRAIDAFRARFGDVELIAGNVATAEGVQFLLDRGVNGIKVGIGPGRRLHDTTEHELRRAAGGGARRLSRSGAGPRSAHR